MPLFLPYILLLFIIFFLNVKASIFVFPEVYNVSQSFGGTYPRGRSFFKKFEVTFDGSLDQKPCLSSSFNSDGTGKKFETHRNNFYEKTGEHDTSNGFPLKLGESTYLLAFRNHEFDPKTREIVLYKLEIVKLNSTSGDYYYLSTIDQDTQFGLWEPFLFHPEGSEENHLQVYYSKERSSNLQDIVSRTSTDGGQTWGEITTVTSHENSREGMPSVVTLADGSLYCVFEGFQDGKWGNFAIFGKYSKDGGRSWENRHLIYSPPRHQNGVASHAGAPFVLRSREGNLLLSFMCDQDHEGEKKWPAFASFLALETKKSNDFDSVTQKTLKPKFNGVEWDLDTLTTVESESVWWPSLYQLEDGDVAFLFGKNGGVSMKLGKLS